MGGGSPLSSRSFRSASYVPANIHGSVGRCVGSILSSAASRAAWLLVIVERRPDGSY